MRPQPAIIIAKLLADALALASAFAAGFGIASAVTQVARGIPYLSLSSPHVTGHAIMFGLFSLAVIIALHTRGHYTERLPWWHQVRQIVLACIAAMLVQGFFHFILKFPLSRLWVGSTWILAIPLLLIARLAVRAVLKKMGRWQVPTIIIGGADNALETAFALHSDLFADYRLQKIILLTQATLTPEKLPPRYKKVEVLHSLTAAQTAITQASGSKKGPYVILAPDESSNTQLNHLLAQLKESGLNFALVPPMLSVSLYNSPPRYFFGHNIVLFHPAQSNDNAVNLALKRLFDVTASFCGLLALSPLFLAIAILIKWQSPQSKVFFGHKRVGQGGRKFTCYKFTSMVPNAEQVLKKLLAEDPAAKAEWDKDFKLKNDPRITPIGKFIRATSLDEIPQIFNVFRGDMSLVGPRPIVPDETKYYGENLAAYLSVKPGITGLWQVSGRNDTSYEYRVYLDTWYANHRSFWHDIVILFETVRIVLNRSGAY